MQLREKVFFIIILIIVILSAVGLRLMQTSKEVETDLLMGVSQYLLDHEFTDICIAWDQIYCSGVDGLFVINPKTNESRLIDSDLRYVRALEYHEASDVLYG